MRTICKIICFINIPTQHLTAARKDEQQTRWGVQVMQTLQRSGSAGKLYKSPNPTMHKHSPASSVENSCTDRSWAAPNDAQHRSFPLFR